MNWHSTVPALVLFITTGSMGLGQERFAIFELTNVWRYQQNVNLDGLGWQQLQFDDSLWPHGEGLFGFEDAPALQPLIRTMLIDPRVPALNQPPPRTYYFRTSFSLSSVRGLSLTFSNRIDDGAAAYLNGVEIWRAGLNAGVLNYASRANRFVGDATTNEVITVAAWNIARVGTNILAVEVHQNVATSSDVVWGCTLTGIIEPQMTIERLQSGVQVCWNSVPNATYRVEYRAEFITNTWATLQTCVPSAGALTCISDAGLSAEANRFYRVAATNCVPEL